MPPTRIPPIGRFWRLAASASLLARQLSSPPRHSLFVLDTSLPPRRSRSACETARVPEDFAFMGTLTSKSSCDMFACANFGVDLGERIALKAATLLIA